VACFVAPAFGAEQILLETKQAKVTISDFEASLVRIPEENRAEVLASKARIRKILENLIISKTFAAKAHKEGLDKDPALRKQMDLAAEMFWPRPDQPPAQGAQAPRFQCTGARIVLG